MCPGNLPAMARLPSGVNDHVGHLFADRHRVDQLDLLALDREHADRVVGAVGDQRQVAGAVDRQARRLLADRDGVDQLRRAGGEVDDVELVVRHRFPAGTVGRPVHRVGHQRELAVGRDAQVGRRAEDRVHQRQAGHDLRVGGVGADVDDGHRVVARRQQLQLAVFAPGDLVVDADHHELGLARHGRGVRTSHEQGRGRDERKQGDAIHCCLQSTPTLPRQAGGGGRGGQQRRWPWPVKRGCYAHRGRTLAHTLQARCLLLLRAHRADALAGALAH